MRIYPIQSWAEGRGRQASGEIRQLAKKTAWKKLVEGKLQLDENHWSIDLECYAASCPIITT